MIATVLYHLDDLLVVVVGHQCAVHLDDLVAGPDAGLPSGAVFGIANREEEKGI